MNVRRTFGILGVLALVMIGIYLITNSEPRFKIDDDEIINRLDYNIKNITEKNVHPLLRPVYLFVGKNWRGSGTLVLNPDETPKCLITAAHIFSEKNKEVCVYEYREITNSAQPRHGYISGIAMIDLISLLSNTILDVAICTVGQPTEIANTSKADTSKDGVSVDATKKQGINSVILTSLQTGEKYSLYGREFQTSSGYWAMEYAAVPGESGAGFLGSDSRLYVLSGTLRIEPEWRAQLGIPEKISRLTLVTGLNWQ